jgi:hypothetical protein
LISQPEKMERGGHRVVAAAVGGKYPPYYTHTHTHRQQPRDIRGRTTPLYTFTSNYVAPFKK